MLSGLFRREVTLEVPEDFPAGEANINVSAGFRRFLRGSLDAPPGDVPIPDFGFDFDGFGDEEERPVPQNLDELIKQMAEDQIDPGLITVTLSSSEFGGFPGFPSDATARRLYATRRR